MPPTSTHVVYSGFGLQPRPPRDRRTIGRLDPGTVIVVPLEDGRRLELRYALPLRRPGVYAARIEGEDCLACLDPDLRGAIAAATGAPRDAPWVAALARQLEAEF